MTMMLNIVPNRCTGCMQCELACSWVQTGTFQPSRSLIRVNVFDEEASYAPFTCLQCDEAWCMNACPVNAIGVDGDSGQRSQRIPVIGCPLCTIAFSVRHRLHAAGDRHGQQVQSLRRGTRLRGGLSDSGDRVCRC
ncbi:MAG: hypothetical protein Ct9H300mP1_02090 [Planctomycetaceae bacterium]|nr:MAG: hypothetical protein Ct9H300mP1_02090 [Planctomycetaceae bacterium]